MTFKVLLFNSFFFFLLASGSGEYQYDSKAFLFSLVNKPGWAPVKLSQTGRDSSNRRSINMYSVYGPTFGYGHDIHIHSHASSNSGSYSKLGWTTWQTTDGVQRRKHLHQNVPGWIPLLHTRRSRNFLRNIYPNIMHEQHRLHAELVQKPILVHVCASVCAYIYVLQWY